MAAEFAPVVEVDFAGNGTWTNITPYVRVEQTVRITRGRGDEQTEIRPGIMSLTLNNTDGRFTPGNAASPYYPNVKKGRPIRCRVVHAGGESTRFFGHVNEWPVTWEGGGAISLSQVTATDPLKRLGRTATMRSLLEEEMLAVGPDAYYTLGEPAGATSAGDTSGNGDTPLRQFIYGTGAGQVKFGQGTGPGTDELPAVVFEPSTANDGVYLAIPRDMTLTEAVVMAVWVNTTVKGRAFLALWGGNSTAVVVKTDPTTGHIIVAASNNRSATISSTFPTVDVADGHTHFVAVQVTPGGGVTVQVDNGALLSATFTPDSTFGPWIEMPAYNWVFVGAGPSFDGPATPGSLFGGTMAHFWYARRATMPDWTNVWQAGNPETTAARFERVCRVGGIAGTVLGSSSTIINAQAARGKAPVGTLADVASVEAGLVYTARDDGTVVFECRNHRFNLPPSASLAELREHDLLWSDDDQYMVNDVSNSRASGAAQRWKDAASIAEYGTYAGGQTLPWSSDKDALLNAQWQVSNGADPPPRVNRFTVVANTLADYADVLALDISDVVTLTGLPAGSPESSTQVHVEGYAETIGYNHHAITFHTSPASVSRVWQLGVPGASELGVNTKLSY
ncbi:hypothetical protein [Nonomuraea sp. NPDC050786]|uniref:hypothetical protein n=1 Tax=Nonomuraea sp. NPDC050786 TaxID=3154840 RepID=UPI0033DAA9F1